MNNGVDDKQKTTERTDAFQHNRPTMFFKMPTLFAMWAVVGKQKRPPGRTGDRFQGCEEDRSLSSVVLDLLNEDRFLHFQEMDAVVGSLMLHHTLHEFTEDSGVECRRGRRLGVKLRSKGKPIGVKRFYRLYHTVRTAASDHKARCDVVDRHVVHTVDPNVVVAVNPLKERSFFDDHRVPMVRVHRIAVRKSLGQVFRNVKEQGSSLRNIEKLHTCPDR